MILRMDLGNTRLKWQLCQNGGEVERGELAPLAIESGLRSLPWSVIEAVQLVSVADRMLTEAIKVSCDSFSSHSTVVREVDLFRLPPWFSLGDTDPAQIGADRVMAMLAGRAEGAPDAAYCVIDAGSALTVDYVSRGQHQGGYVVPGLGLSRAVLGQQTARIGTVRPEFYSALLEPGRVTQRAVEHGIRRQLIAFCQDAIANPPCAVARVLLTGGDAEWLLGHLAGPIERADDLVFDGLSHYFDALS